MSKKDIKEPQEEDSDLVWKEEDEKESEESKIEEKDEEIEEESNEEVEDSNEEEGEEDQVESEKEEMSEAPADAVEDEESGPVKTEETEENQDEPEVVGEDIKRSDILRRDLNQFVRDNQPSYSLNQQDRRSSKKLVTLILFILAILVIGGGIYFMAGLGGSKKPSPTPTPSPTLEPTPTPKALNREEWPLEVLNGSGVTGAAKKLADQLKALGYPVVKTGNADRDDYTSNQIFVKKEMQESVELLILDIKDIIKIASVSGELKDSTASARIIIGK